MTANHLKRLAERMRFELTIGFPLYALSRGAHRMREGRIYWAKRPAKPPSRPDSTQPETGTPEHYRWSRVSPTPMEKTDGCPEHTNMTARREDVG